MLTSMEEKVIPILRVDDAEVAVAWYQRLGFRQTLSSLECLCARRGPRMERAASRQLHAADRNAATLNALPPCPPNQPRWPLPKQPGEG
jgi:hypothetical protein